MIRSLRFGFFLFAILSLSSSVFAQNRNVTGEYLVRYGEKLYKEGNLDDARHEFSKALLADPGNEKAKRYLNELGLVDGLYQPMKRIRVEFPHKDSQSLVTRYASAPQEKRIYRRSPSQTSDFENQTENLKDALESQSAQIDAYKNLNKDYQGRLKEADRLLAEKEFENAEPGKTIEVAKAAVPQSNVQEEEFEDQESDQTLEASKTVASKPSVKNERKRKHTLDPDYDERLAKQNKAWADHEEEALALNRQFDDLNSMRDDSIQKLMNDSDQMLSDEVLERDRRLAEKEAEVDKLQNELEKLNEKIPAPARHNNRQNTPRAGKSSVAKNSSKAADREKERIDSVLNRQADEIRDLQDKYDQQLQRQNRLLDQKENQISGLKKDMNDLASLLDESKAEPKSPRASNQKEKVLRLAKKENDLAALSQELKETKKNLDQNRQKFEDTMAALKDLERTKEKELSLAKDQYANRLQNKAPALDDKDNEIDSLKTDINKLALTLEETKDKAAEAEELRLAKNEYATRLQNKAQDLDEKESEIESLKGDINKLSLALEETKNKAAEAEELRIAKEAYADRLNNQAQVLDEKENEIGSLKTDVNKLSSALEETKNKAAEAEELRLAKEEYANQLKNQSQTLDEKDDQIGTLKTDLDNLAQELEQSKDKVAKSEELQKAQELYAERLQDQEEALENKENEIMALKDEVNKLSAALRKSRKAAKANGLKDVQDQYAKRLQDQALALEKKENQISALKKDMNELAMVLDQSKVDAAKAKISKSSKKKPPVVSMDEQNEKGLLLEKKEKELAALSQELNQTKENLDQDKKKYVDTIAKLKNKINRQSLERSKDDSKKWDVIKQTLTYSTDRVDQLNESLLMREFDLINRDHTILSKDRKISHLQSALNGQRNLPQPQESVADKGNPEELEKAAQERDGMINNLNDEIKNLQAQIDDQKGTLSKHATDQENSAKNIGELEENVKKLTAALQEKEAMLKEQDSKISTKDDALAEKENELKSMRNQLEDVSRRIEGQKDMTMAKADEMKALNANMDALIKELQGKHAELSNLLKDVEAVKSEEMNIDEKEKLLAQKEQELKAAQDQLNAASREMEEQKALLADKSDEYAQLSNQLEQLNGELEDTDSDIKRAQKKLKKQKNKTKGKKAKVEKEGTAEVLPVDENELKSQKEMAEKAEQMKKRQGLIEEKSNEIQALRAQVGELSKDLQDRNEKLNRLQNKVKTVHAEKNKPGKKSKKRLTDTSTDPTVANLSEAARKLDEQRTSYGGGSNEFELLNDQLEQLNDRLKDKGDQLSSTKRQLEGKKYGKNKPKAKGKKVNKRSSLSSSADSVLLPEPTDTRKSFKSKDNALDDLSLEVARLDKNIKNKGDELKATKKNLKEPRKNRKAEKVRRKPVTPQEVRDCEDELAELKSKLANKENQLGQLSEQMENQNKELMSLRQQIMEQDKNSEDKAPGSDQTQNISRENEPSSGSVSSSDKKSGKPTKKRKSKSLTALKQKLAEKEDQLTLMSGEMTEQTQEIDTLKQQMQNLEQDLLEKDQELIQTQNNLNEIKEQSEAKTLNILKEVNDQSEVKSPTEKESKKQKNKEVSGLKEKLNATENQLNQKESALDLQQKIITALNTKIDDLNQKLEENKPGEPEISEDKKQAPTSSNAVPVEAQDSLYKLAELECPSSIEDCAKDMYSQSCLVALIKRKDACIAKLKDKLATAKKISSALERRGTKNCADAPEVKALKKVVTRKQAEVTKQDLEIKEIKIKMQSMNNQVSDVQQRQDLSQRIIAEKDKEIKSLTSELQQIKIKCKE